MGGIRLGYRQIGQVDLVEIIVLHRPEDIAPGAIQGGDVTIVARTGNSARGNQPRKACRAASL